jgi:hypothetical protein
VAWQSSEMIMNYEEAKCVDKIPLCIKVLKIGKISTTVLLDVYLIYLAVKKTLTCKYKNGNCNFSQIILNFHLKCNKNSIKRDALNVV